MTEAELFQRMQGYVGRAYVDGVYDCMDLASDVVRDLFGRAIALPPGRARPQGAAGQRREISALRDAVAMSVPAPFTGCGAMLIRPTANGENWHVGIVCLHQDETWVLHNSHHLGSAHFHRLSDLRHWGMRLEGYYAWT